MTVEELRIILDGLDPDMEILYDDLGQESFNTYAALDKVRVREGSSIESIYGSGEIAGEDYRKGKKFLVLE